jgi:hypothetical protein
LSRYVYNINPQTGFATKTISTGTLNASEKYDRYTFTGQAKIYNLVAETNSQTARYKYVQSIEIPESESAGTIYIKWASEPEYPFSKTFII